MRRLLAHRLFIRAVAILLPLVSLAAFLFIPDLKDYVHPLLLFFPCVVFITWYGGARAGIMTAAISTLALLYLFLYVFHIPVTRISTFLETAIFFIEGLLLSYVIEYFKQTDQELLYRQKEQKFKTLIARLEKEKIQGEDAIKARDEFLSLASHELRTPLTTMLLQLQTALHNVRNVSLANFSVQNLMTMLESTEQQSRRLSKMINDLLNISLITTGRLELEPQDADLVTITHDVIARFAEKLEKENITLTLKGDESVPLFCDKLRIEQVITNLLTNAIKYGNSEPIEILVKKENGNALLQIKDHGIGIQRDKQKVIFAKFQRAVSPHNYEGLGVGLFITQQIIHAHGGRIQVESNVGKGTTFTVRLPIAKQTNQPK